VYNIRTPEKTKKNVEANGDNRFCYSDIVHGRMLQTKLLQFRRL